MAIRIQRKRTKGWKMPENTVYVGRPTKWGNPFDLSASSHCWTAIQHGFKADKTGRLDASISMFKDWLRIGKSMEIDCGLSVRIKNKGKFRRVSSSPMIKTVTPPTTQEIKAELQGKNLACFCPVDQQCHADVLLELANGKVK